MILLLRKVAFLLIIIIFVKNKCMEKINISEKEKLEIFNKHNSGLSIRRLGIEYDYSFTVIQKLIHSFEYEQQIEINYPPKEGYYIVAICNQTQKEIKDYKNESGAIAEHVFKLYPKESKNSKFIRKSIEYKTGKFWYDEYFTFDYRKIKETKKCHYCDWTTEDIENLSGAYEKHLLLKHDINIEQHINNNNLDDRLYFKKNIPPKDGVICAICGKTLRILNHKHLMRKHQISLWEYKLQYGCDNIVSPSTKFKLNDSWNQNLKNQGFKKTSSYEINILSILNKKSLVSGDRTVLNGLEIDIYDTDLKIGFEINGVYYHSEINGGKNKQYHLNKQLVANENGIELMHIFEDEIYYKKNIVISKMKHALGINDNKKIYAKNCNVKIINQITANDFYNNNHIQGYVPSLVDLGIYCDDVLMAAMSFNNKRNMNKEHIHNSNVFELTRFATSIEYLVVGAGGKLLNYFISNYKPQRIISFADRRWTINCDNNFYTKMGFKLINTLSPDYTYVNGKINRYQRFHKFGFGKNAIKKRFPEVYDESKTEWQMMQELGYDRIWDCGKFKYELNVS
jgi:hypothetical protein